ncbi:ATP-binding cassette domain-containing protein [Candidatus Phytoplasma pini]|uniref:ABC-type cobalt transport system, ATPase component n=1 Tax=Candidatus Phytoplasma pini TaxID=267362 RepID=A0A559KJM6_9MOLU|nr:ATP-binding cassette domain-containing protein [Candidatus Phytoplasma pini]TVY12331.1 ABC-type cobalt transport system, ATPase component [Candidatus Phytoplasma pini]
MAIQFRNVSFLYNKRSSYVLRDINLKINSQNDFIALIGRIGSGKSTLVQLMNGLLIPSEGEIEIFNQKINSKTPYQKIIPLRQKIGLVFQLPEYQLFETTVLKDVMFSPKNFNKNDLESKKIAIQMLKLVGIDKDLFHVSPFKLSGGQKRKVAIAGVLAMNPSILILDEPTRGLDIKNKIEIMTILKQANQKDKKTVIYITHDIDLAAEYANKIIFLEKGEVLFSGYKKDFFLYQNLSKFGFYKPQIFQIMDFLKQKINLPFVPQYSFQELMKYLKTFYKKNSN